MKKISDTCEEPRGTAHPTPLRDRTQYPSRQADQLQVRMPDGLRDRIKDAAALAGRSMNAEVIQRLEASFGTPSSLPPEFAATLEAHIDREVRARIARMASALSEAQP